MDSLSDELLNRNAMCAYCKGKKTFLLYIEVRYIADFT